MTGLGCLLDKSDGGGPWRSPQAVYTNLAHLPRLDFQGLARQGPTPQMPVLHPKILTAKRALIEICPVATALPCLQNVTRNRREQ